MRLVLEGKIITPIITKKTNFYVEGCNVRIIHPRRRYISKITVGKPMFPYSLIGYLGGLELIVKCKSKQKTQEKIIEFLKIDSIGRFSSEGFGRIQWFSGKIVANYDSESRKKFLKIRIRKGLPHHLPKKIQKLLKYNLLHDFFHTSQHRSKIYLEPELLDKKLIELLRQHHAKTENEIIKQFQRYDHISAIITRTVYSPRTNRYNWTSTKNIDFQKIVNEIKVVASNIWKLYDYIYSSKELDSLNGSLYHGHTSLRKHVLVCANLIVQDFKYGKLTSFAQE